MQRTKKLKNFRSTLLYCAPEKSHCSYVSGLSYNAPIEMNLLHCGAVELESSKPIFGMESLRESTLACFTP